MEECTYTSAPAKGTMVISADPACEHKRVERTKPKPLQCSAQCKALAETLHKVLAETQHSALAETLQALAETLLWGCAGVALPG